MDLAFAVLKNKKGFIAIVSVLILGALLIFLGAVLFHSTLSEFSNNLALEKKETADFLARACLDEGIFKLKENINYQGEEKLKINGEECLKIEIKDVGTSTKIVSSLVAVGEPPHFQKKEREIKYYLFSKEEDWRDYQELENLEILGDILKLKEGKIERVTTSSAQWADFFELSNLQIFDDTLRLQSTNGGFATSGYRISLPLSLDKIKEVKESQISWLSQEPSDTSILIETALNSDPNVKPESFVEAVNGDSIPGINVGDDLTGKYLWVKETLKTASTNTTPILDELKETILGKTKGYWISQPIEVLGENKEILDSQIFWEEESFSDSFITIEIRTSEDGISWQGWQKVENGGKILGFEKGEILNSKFFQIKANFEGGPQNYPLLKKISLFFELKL